MTAEDTSVVVQLVHHDVAQVLEEALPLGVVGEDAAVQHVGVGDDDVTGQPDGAPCRDGGVAVVGVGLDVGAGQLDQPVELGVLILGEGFGGEEVERPARRILEDRLEDRGVVAERFAAGGGGDDGDVLTAERRLDRFLLVGVGARDTALA